MNTDPGGEDSARDGPDRWESVARTTLSERLETVAHSDVRDAFDKAAQRLKAGDELTEQDISDLRQAIWKAANITALAAEASPEACPAPDPWDFLDEDARSEWAREADRRHPATAPEE